MQVCVVGALADMPTLVKCWVDVVEALLEGCLWLVYVEEQVK